MNKVSMILTGLLMLTMVAFMAPSIIAMNRGKALRNIALWLAIFLGLALFYRSFGPGSPHPLFNLPQAMMMPGAGVPASEAPATSGDQGAPPKD